MKKLLVLIALTCLSLTGLIAQETKQEQPKEQAQIEAPKPAVKLETTFAMIKPDAVEAGHTGEIIKLIELNGFTISNMQKKHLHKKQVKKFYKEHKDKHFFGDLINYITSGPVILLTLEKPNAIADWRKLIGSTKPENAEVGTLRKMFGSSSTKNAVHGSDSAESAQRELKFFFPETF